MKQLLTLVLLVIAAVSLQAQQHLIATLYDRSAGEVTQYYGISAFSEAYSYASIGDIIYLSPGIFTAPEVIGKTITVHGSGMNNNMKIASATNKTYISGDFTLNIENPTFEGVTFTDVVTIFSGCNATFIKCYFPNDLQYEGGGGTSSGSFLDCVILKMTSIYEGMNITFNNSYLLLQQLLNNSGSDYPCEFINCMIEGAKDNFVAIPGSTFRNCIINVLADGNNICNVKIYNSLIIESEGEAIIERDCFYASNYTRSTTEGLFTESGFYELTSENQEGYTGDDGTQVGIYGGIMPFDPTPSNPQITDVTVGTRSESDGTLPFTIHVN